jgi:hypothetical protein
MLPGGSEIYKNLPVPEDHELLGIVSMPPQGGL